MIRRVIKKIESYIEDVDTRKYVKHSGVVFGKGEAHQMLGGPEILFELNQAHSSHIAYAYLARCLVENFGGCIKAYTARQPASLIKRLEWQILHFLSLREFNVYESFGTVAYVLPKISAHQANRARQRTEILLESIRTKRDIEEIHLDGVWVGDLIYDSYLRDCNKPTIAPEDRAFKSYLLAAVETYTYWCDYFNAHDVRALNLSHCGFVSSIPLRIALKRSIPSFQANATHLYRLSQERPIAYTEFIDFPDLFSKLPIEIQKSGPELAKRRIDRRLSGEVGVDMAYVKNTAYGAFKSSRLITESPRKKVLVATHCFFDSPHGYGGNLFPDLYDWIYFLGEMSLNTDYDWYIKTHPDYLEGTVEVIDSFINKYTKFVSLPADASHHQIINEGIDVALTVYGTIGFEYAALGIPVINASRCNPHIAYDFNFHPKDMHEYEQMLLNLGGISLQINKMQVYEYYYMKHLYYSDSWLFKDYNQTILKIGGYAEQFTSKVYGNWLEDFTAQRHDLVVAILQKFVSSGDFRLGPQHDVHTLTNSGSV